MARSAPRRRRARNPRYRSKPLQRGFFIEPPKHSNHPIRKNFAFAQASAATWCNPNISLSISRNVARYQVKKCNPSMKYGEMPVWRLAVARRRKPVRISFCPPSE
jgi:hypothetical protein